MFFFSNHVTFYKLINKHTDLIFLLNKIPVYVMYIKEEQIDIDVVLYLFDIGNIFYCPRYSN